MLPPDLKKILIIRPDRIGDLICITPAITTLRENFPGAEITAILSPFNCGLLKNTHLLDRIIIWDTKKSLREKIRFIKDLRKEEYDLALILCFTSDEAYILTLLCRAKARAGVVVKDRILTALFTSFFLKPVYFLEQQARAARGEKLIHEVDECLNMLKTLGIKDIKNELNVPLPAAVLAEAEEYLNSISSEKYKGIIALSVCRKFFKEGWHGRELGEVAEEIKKKFPEYLLFITYGSEEIEDGEYLEKLFDSRDGITVKGLLPLQLWAAVLRKVSLIVSFDSAAVHMGASGKVPSVVIYQEKDYRYTYERWYPWQVPHRPVMIKDFSETLEAILEGMVFLLN